ncbi:FadR/GntR family transcriptional regulator [Shinella sp.]|uniref:FadR/GntR family transcriptional regulator n=1 Tax=Shinella sp. TaxID=1870904 RepID=UPI00258A67B1|nr:FadR/GntR family transcriptional regulator [Shinella sp.]MCW5706882.1 FadR family transcriptional regulator [Shinella sp.]
MVADNDGTSDRSSAVDQVVGQIRDLIRDRAFVVGNVLPPEAELATMFGAGRNTVREAVRTLKAYGILESRQKIGAVITDRRTAAVADLFSVAMEVSVDTFRDIQGFRRLTEMNLGKLIVGRISDADLRRLESANAQMAATNDPTLASEYDFEFHQVMIEAAGNGTLSEIYQMLKPVICRLMQSGKTQRQSLNMKSAEQHTAIVQALREGEILDFQYHMNRHLAAGLEFIPPSRPS